MKIDLKIVFLVFFVLCLASHIDGWWGGGGSRRGGSRSPSTSRRSSGGWFGRSSSRARTSGRKSTSSYRRSSGGWFGRSSSRARTSGRKSTSSYRRSSGGWFGRRSSKTRTSARKSISSSRRSSGGWFGRSSSRARTSGRKSTSSYRRPGRIIRRPSSSRRSSWGWFGRPRMPVARPKPKYRVSPKRIPVSRRKPKYRVSRKRLSWGWFRRQRTPVPKPKPKYTVSPKRKPVSVSKTKYGVSLSELKDMTKVISKFEGFEPKVYKDSKGRKAVGYGFDLDQPDAKKMFRKALPGVSFENVKSGKQTLTKSQASKLLESSLKGKIETTRRIIPKFDKLPSPVKTALVNAVYRGELKKGHKTVQLMNKGEWKKAAKEYLNHKGYKEASKPGSKSPGIKTRMDFNAKAFEKYGKELKKKG